MEEITDFQRLELEKVANETLEGFCDRYLEDAARVVNSGVIFSEDYEMIRLSLSIIIGLYYKRIAEGIETGEKVAH